MNRIAAGGVNFHQGDVRQRDDMMALGAFDWLIECSAEPSVLGGSTGSTAYLTDTNLGGAISCAEACVRNHAGMLFLSTSRVYEIEPLCHCSLREEEQRYAFAETQNSPGLSAAGVSERFSTDGEKSLYGATKLAAEVMLAEFGYAFKIPILINRCAVLAGPWQFGRVDQGVVPFWVESHLRGRPMRYIGFGGSGKQVRDILHIDDLVELVLAQLAEPDKFVGHVFNVGGGLDNSVSLLELTEICRRITGKETELTPEPETRYADLPIFIADCSAIKAHCGWQPKRDVATVVEDLPRWLVDQSTT
jgi:CDP-paratose 2-epimerase